MASYLKKLLLLAGFLSLSYIAQNILKTETKSNAGNLESKIIKAKATKGQFDERGNCFFEDADGITYRVLDNEYVKGKSCAPDVVGVEFTEDNTPYENNKQCGNARFAIAALDEDESNENAFDCGGKTRVLVYKVSLMEGCTFKMKDREAYFCGLYRKSILLSSESGCCADIIAMALK